MRGRVAILAAAMLIFLPINSSIASADDTPDTTLAVFTVNGTAITSNDQVVDLPLGTSSVDVVATPNDTTTPADVAVSGANNLHAGHNPLSVTVTNGSASTVYTADLNVLTTPNTLLKTFEINGISVTSGDSLTLPVRTTTVSYSILTDDVNATTAVSGVSTQANTVEVHNGTNTFTVTVSNGDLDPQVYTVTLIVPLSNNSGLSTITVNGTAVPVDGSINIPYATSATVVALAADVDATVSVSGATNLHTGDNSVTVTVTAANGAVANYGFLINVAANTDTSLSGITVDGSDVVADGSIDVDYTTSVDVSAITTDPTATVVVSGNTGLHTGANTVSVAVTAADGTTTHTYSFTVNVAANTDASLSTFTVNGELVVDGDYIDLPYGTDHVTVVATATDSNAGVVVVGATDLASGENSLVVTVTAADGVTTEDYIISLNVAYNADTSLATFQVNGADVVDGDSIDLDPLTDSVEVVVETTDPDASYEITGDTDLVAGENTLSVTVTAADQETVDQYNVTLNVAFNTDTSLSSFQVNGTEVVDGDVVELDYGTDFVDVSVETSDPNATYEIVGDTDLVSGDNTLTVTVTAADSSTTEDYVVELNVALNSDTSLTTFQVNGTDVLDGDVIDLDPLTDSVEVTVETTDPEATFEITGDTGLGAGENTLAVVVTAADGQTTDEFDVTLNVLPNTDTSVATLQVNGVDVADADSVALDYGTESVDVTVETTDSVATYEISGDTGLVSGDNILVITVTAADGETTQDYTITLSVALNNDTSIATFQVNGVDVQDGDTLDLDPLTTDVEVTVETTDPEAGVEISGDTDLTYGDNTLLVTVTAADGETTQDYTVTLTVPLNNDTSLSSFQVNGTDVQDGDSVTLDPYATTADVAVETTDPDATFEIVGDSDLVVGDNTLVVTVTAADAVATQDYTVTLTVPLGNDTNLSVFQVNGTDVADGDSVDLDPLTDSVEVTVETTDADASYEITGDTGLIAGENTLVVTVTAADGETTQDYTVTLNVALNPTLH